MISIKKFKNDVIIHNLFIMFILLSGLYFFTFTLDVADFDNYRDYTSFIEASDSIFKRAINIHDHFVYIDYIEELENGTISFTINNNTGIAYFYYILKKMFNVNMNDLVFISFIVNLCIIYLAMLSFCKVVSLLKLQPNYFLLFLFNGSLFYFAQLINKDSFTLFIFIKALELVLSKKLNGFYWLIPFSFIVRMQLAPFLLLFLFLTKESRPLLRFWFAYLLTAILAGLVAKFIPLIELETMQSGSGLNVNLLLLKFNQKYIVGSIFINPIRVLQYLFSILQSLNFSNGLTFLDIGKMKDLPQIVTLFISMPLLIKSYFYYQHYNRLASRVLMAQISAFFMIWLINPTTNSRYILIVIPSISLLAAYLYEAKKGSINVKNSLYRSI